jgi:hypothetical protein
MKQESYQRATTMYYLAISSSDVALKESIGYDTGATK